MEKIVVGLLGVLLNEYFRRNARIEKYSEKVIEKRLEIYERFSKEISSAASLISNLVNAEDFDSEQKQEIAFTSMKKLLCTVVWFLLGLVTFLVMSLTPIK